MPAPQYNICDRRRNRQNVTAFSALIKTPATGSVVLPANGRISLVSVGSSTAGTLAATLTGPFYDQSHAHVNRLIKTPALAAGGRVVIDRLERGVTIALSSGFQAYVDVGLGKWAKIASNP